MGAGPGWSHLNYARDTHRVLLDAYPQISCSDTRHLWLMAHFLFKFNSVTAQSHFVPWKKGWKLCATRELGAGEEDKTSKAFSLLCQQTSEAEQINCYWPLTPRSSCPTWCTETQISKHVIKSNSHPATHPEAHSQLHTECKSPQPAEASETVHAGPGPGSVFSRWAMKWYHCCRSRQPPSAEEDGQLLWESLQKPGTTRASFT